MRECPFCWEDIDTMNDVITTTPYLQSTQTIAACPSCHAKVEVSYDAEFDDGMWHDLTTIRPLKALQLHIGEAERIACIYDY